MKLDLSNYNLDVLINSREIIALRMVKNSKRTGMETRTIIIYTHGGAIELPFDTIELAKADNIFADLKEAFQKA